ncbi:MAG TPA: amino acid adenylation domain-containing protein [Pyrinomonadaceae bacterium]|nr:amino acid adenylation domain-containing protein [Pyrinomonadaceae bacterium]
MPNDAKHIAELSPTERAALVARLKQQRAAARAAAHYPLSFAQQRLWFLEQLEPDGPYKVPAAFRLRGPLNVAALEQSVNSIISRHEVLRTTFAEIDGQPVQIVAPRLTLSIPVEDLSQLPDAERSERVKQIAARLREHPFDFVLGPLVGTALVRLTENEYHFWFLMHHIVSDGWSIGVILNELTTAYESFAAGRQPELPKLPIQYADFAVWQRTWLQGETLDRQLKYWQERLDCAPTLELPTDRPRPPVQSYRGASLTHLIDRELTSRLKALARRENVTPYMLLLAVFKTLLARYTRQDDVVVGTPVANRNRTELEPLVGFFVNTLVLRTDLSGDPTFRELLGRVREVTLGAFAHQDVPFEKLVEELQPERDTSRTPLFQVMFSLQNAPLPPLRMSDIEISLLDDETEVSLFDLSLDVIERTDGLLCTLEYNTDLFDSATVRRMLKHFAVLLDPAVTDPSARLNTLPLFTDEERRQLFQWNDTRRDFPRDRCVHELFEQQAARTPEAVALVCGSERLTYAELNVRANQLAHHLRACGVKAEARVGILLERSVEMAVALLAILKAGGGYVAFDPSYPAERLRYMLDDSGVTLLLTQQNVMPNDFHVRSIFLDVESIAEHDTQNLQSGVDPSNIVYLVYTSGSTGRPKGIVIEHRSLVNAAYGFISNHRLTERDRLLQFASLSFDVAAEEFFAAWLSGSCVVMREEAVMSYADFVSLLQREKVTIVNLPASFWLEWLTALNDRDLAIPHTLRRVIVGNEKTLEETLAKWQRTVGQQVEWCNAYGPSETTITASNYEPATNSAREGNSVVPIGRPSLNAELYVLDPAQQLIPAGVAGELYIGGVGLARGYHSQPAQTAERFIPHSYSQNAGERLYRTGDLARYRADGNVEFLGRIDEQVKIRGFRVEVGEVEAVLAQHAGVRESVVVALEDDRGSTRLIAYVVANNGDLETAELRDYLKQRLSEYMVPSAIVQLESFPLTPNGKIDRKALPAPNAASREADGPYIAPRSELESLIAEVWREALSVERVSVRDNFFNLGGHSLLLIRVNNRLRETLRIELPVVELFKYPTVSALAEHLSRSHAQPRPTRTRRTEPENRAASLSRQRELRRRRPNAD